MQISNVPTGQPGPASADEVLNRAIQALADDGKANLGVAFALCYVYDGNTALLRGMTSELDERHVPKRIAVQLDVLERQEEEQHEDLWSVGRAISSRRMTKVVDCQKKVLRSPASYSAVSVPLELFAEDNEVLGVLVLGFDAEKVIDRVLQGFLELLARQLAHLISSTRTYEEQRMRAEALAEIDRAKTIFFQNRLANIRDVLDSTAGVMPLEATEKLEMAYSNSLRLLKLVNSLLEFSTIEADRQRANFVPASLSALTKDVASMFESAFQEAGIAFSVVVESFPGDVEVYIDKDMWEKIVLNLVSNAIKYTLAGKVEVRLVHEAGNMEGVDLGQTDYAVLTVSDTGIGIPEKDVPLLFNRFHRVQGPQGRSIEGSGIGCPLVKEMVNFHSGTIEVQSKLGEGTTFTVRIPMKKAVSSSPATSSSAPLSSRPSRKVEDNLLQRRAFVEEALRWLPEQSVTRKSKALGTLRPSPLLIAEGERRETDSCASPLSPSAKAVILLVDDNADMRNYIRSALTSEGYDVVLRNNGLEAYQYLQDERNTLPDLIVSDIMMPYMDGLELLDKVRAGINKRLTSHTPVIFLSARAGKEARLNGLQQGADDYLVKPFSKQELLSRVEFHLSIAVTRKRLEEQVSEQTKELQESERRYRELAENVPVGIYILDTQGKVTFANDCWKTLFGLKRSQSEEENLDAWEPQVHPDDRAKAKDLFINRAIEMSRESSMELRLVRSDGAVAFVYARQIPTFKDSRLTGFFGVTTDITKTKELEEENIKAIRRTELEQRKRAEEAEENRSRLQTYVDVISHEIRNPISNILNIADVLKDRFLEVEKMLADSSVLTWHDDTKRSRTFTNLQNDVELLSALELCANHQRLITDDVLELSRLQSTQFVLSDEAFEPRLMLKDVIKMFRVRLEEEQVQVSLHMPSEEEISLLPKTLLGDSKRISQVLINLISNALKFMAKAQRKHLTISLSADPGSRISAKGKEEEGSRILRYTVTDTGIGMTQEEQASLFRPFSQANIKTYKEYGGSGMGLFISRILVEKLGGSIQVKSKLGCETSFTFTAVCKCLPMAPSPSSLSLATSSAADPSPAPGSLKTTSRRDSLPLEQLSVLQGKRVLIVDDNVLNQKILNKQLKSVGMRTAVADNGLEAVHIIQRSQSFEESRFDIVLMDVEMPVLNGVEAVQEIRKWERSIGLPAVVVIGLSGNAREEHVQEALRAGMTSYATKPYKREALISRIVKLLLQQPPV